MEGLLLGAVISNNREARSDLFRDEDVLNGYFRSLVPDEEKHSCSAPVVVLRTARDSSLLHPLLFGKSLLKFDAEGSV